MGGAVRKFHQLMPLPRGNLLSSLLKWAVHLRSPVQVVYMRVQRSFSSYARVYLLSFMRNHAAFPYYNAGSDWKILGVLTSETRQFPCQ